MSAKKIGYKIVDWFLDYGSHILNTLIVVTLGILKYFNPNTELWIKILIFFLLVIFGVSYYFILKRQKRTTKLESELSFNNQKIAQLESSIGRWQRGFDEFFKHSLIFLFNSLGYGENERISIYEHNSENNTFVMIGRYSKNPIFNKAGRSHYPDDEGYIANGWTGTEFCQSNLPDPEESFDEYFDKINSDCKISRSIVKKLSMKSRSYCVHSVDKPVTQEKIGVIVLESTKFQKFNGVEAGQVAVKINELFYAYIVCKREC